MIVQIDKTFSTKKWNSYATHPLQSWEWGVARSSMGIEVVRLLDASTKNIYQMTLHRIPFLKKYIGYIPRSAPPTNELIAYLTTYAKEHNIAYIKFEPNTTEYKGTAALVRSSTPLFPQWTQTIDLQKNEDELLAAMKSKTRYNTRLAARHGVIITESHDADGFETFIKLYFETCKRQKYHGHTYAYHKEIFTTLAASGIARILIATYEDKPLAAYELFLFNKKLYYPYGGSSTASRHVMAPNLLMWETIRCGKKWGATSFDMWGSLAPDNDNNNAWSGFTRFKQGYGAEFTQMCGSWDLPTNRLEYRAISLAQRARNALLTYI